MRLFADDTGLYLTISTFSQSEILKNDFYNLERWSHKWDMEFNPSKCQVIHLIWGYTYTPEIEIVQLSFCKRYLSVKHSINTRIVLGEMVDYLYALLTCLIT